MPTAVITALVDDQAGHPRCAAHHGLSFHIALPGMTILFDCGEDGGMMLSNAAVLGIPLDSLDCVVISHAHHDHGNGFPALAARGRIGRLVTGPEFYTPKYRVRNGEPAPVGVNFDAGLVAGHGIPHEVCHGVLQLHEGCWAVGGCTADPADSARHGFAVPSGDGWREDLFGDEICLALRCGDGVAVIAGCSHPGIAAMATAVRDRLGLPVRGVWGGIHLDGREAAATDTLRCLRGLGASRFGFTHCSGEAMREMVREDPDLADCCLRAGASMELSW